MNYSTKKKLYYFGTTALYILVAIAALIALVYSIFGVLLTREDSYAVVKFSYFDFYKGSTESVNFFLDKNDRVNHAVATASTGNKILWNVGFRNYKIEDAVKHYFENLAMNSAIKWDWEYDSYDSSFKTYDIVVLSSSDNFTHLKEVCNNITKTTNNCFAEIGIKAAVDLSLSSDIEGVYKTITGENITLTENNILMRNIEIQKYIENMTELIHQTHAFTCSDRAAYNVKLQELKDELASKISNATDDSYIKSYKEDFEYDKEMLFDQYKYSSEEYFNELNYKYEEKIESLKYDFELKVSEFKILDGREEIVAEIKAYQETESTIYEIEKQA